MRGTFLSEILGRIQYDILGYRHHLHSRRKRFPRPTRLPNLPRNLRGNHPPCIHLHHTDVVHPTRTILPKHLLPDRQFLRGDLRSIDLIWDRSCRYGTSQSPRGVSRDLPLHGRFHRLLRSCRLLASTQLTDYREVPEERR